MNSIADFRVFRDVGQRLGRLHVRYESVAPYPATIDAGGVDLESVTDPVSFFRVVKMKHPEQCEEERPLDRLLQPQPNDRRYS